jgi:lysylphosphatidylglycerol synthetase-like protein (DUF2156 family)
MQQTEILEKPININKTLLESLIHKWGCAISEAVFDFNCSHFSIPEIEGFIGYQVFHSCAVVIGDPICAAEKKIQLALAFQKYCQENCWNCIYFIASESFANWAIQNISKIKIGVGDEMFFDPSINITNGGKNQKLRNKIHHAQHQGLSVKEYLSYDPNMEKAILEVGKTWQNSKKGPQIYLANLDFFDTKMGRRWFYLLEREKVIGMSLLTKLEAYCGWLLKFNIIIPEVPRGASELLMTSIFETLSNENCRYLTYGIIPADDLNNITGINQFTSWIIKLGFKTTKWMFKLNQRKNYWHQFQPKFRNSYLLFSNPNIGIKEILAITSTLKTDFRGLL